MRSLPTVLAVATEISYLDHLLIDNPDSESVTLNEVKQLPKKATLSQIKQLLAKFERLMGFGDAKRLFSTIATTKIKHFAAYARTLDAAEFQDIQLPKRRTLPKIDKPAERYILTAFAYGCNLGPNQTLHCFYCNTFLTWV